MNFVIAGGHGQIALRLTGLLVVHDNAVTGLIRDPDQEDDLIAVGADPVVCDLETATQGEIETAVAKHDAIVFAAGAGPGSGPERKETVDYAASKRLLDAARVTGIRRYVMISAMGAGDPPTDADDDVFSVYLRAKARADAELRAAGLDHTIVRPGQLTDDPGTDAVDIGASLSGGAVTRDDVAAVLAGVLVDPGTIGRTFDVVNGTTPIEDAVAGVEAAIPPDAP